MRFSSASLALAVLVGSSSLAVAVDSSFGVSQQVDRLSTLLADPSMREEQPSARIVQRLDFGRVGLVATVLTYSAVGGTGYEQALALFEETSTSPSRFTLVALLNQAGAKGLRTITRVLPQVTAANAKRRLPSFEVEAIDENAESPLLGRATRVRFEFELGVYLGEVAARILMTPSQRR